MEILVNGKTVDTVSGLTVAGFVAQRGLKPETIVVEYNQAIVAREAWPALILKPGDRLEIVAFVGGG